MDDLVDGMVKRNDAPLVTLDMALHLFEQQDPLKKEIDSLLDEIETVIDSLSVSHEKKQALNETLAFLKLENKKEHPKKFIFQGMLANFSGISEIEPWCKQIAEKLELS